MFRIPQMSRDCRGEAVWVVERQGITLLVRPDKKEGTGDTNRGFIKRDLVHICRNKMNIPLGEGDGDSLLFKGLVDGIHELMRGKASVPWVFYPAQ